jgi:uncharacterized membrane protein
MSDSFRVFVAAAGTLFLLISMLDELFRPEPTINLHRQGLILYLGGLTVMIPYLVFALRRRFRKGNASGSKEGLDQN